MKKIIKTIGKILLSFAIVFALALGVYCYFGGFGTGDCADTEEFAKYAEYVEQIKIPKETRIVALGEATHGNKEFQQLKLDVLQVMVEKYGIRSFALEADYGCCEIANMYIHGAEGTPQQAAAALGFRIYQTDEMANLLKWMRDYNEAAKDGEDLRFYGFDMQSYDESYNLLIKALNFEYDTDTIMLESIFSEESEYDYRDKEKSLKSVKSLLVEKGAEEKIVHCADILLQNLELGKTMSNMNEGIKLRDKFMAENVMWILQQEEGRGNRRIFISGHNGHIDQFCTYDEINGHMGRILADTIGADKYFAIGTDFYKTKNNMPKDSLNRTTFTAYSYNPLAKAAKKCGYDVCWLDFGKIPDNSALYNQITDYCYMGNLGENQVNMLSRIIMRVLPHTYRIWGSPANMYDGMIFVSEASPIDIL